MLMSIRGAHTLTRTQIHRHTQADIKVFARDWRTAIEISIWHCAYVLFAFRLAMNENLYTHANWLQREGGRQQERERKRGDYIGSPKLTGHMTNWLPLPPLPT